MSGDADWEERIRADFQKHPGSWRPDPQNWWREGWLTGFAAGKAENQPIVDLMRSLSINPEIPQGFRSIMKSALNL